MVQMRNRNRNLSQVGTGIVINSLQFRIAADKDMSLLPYLAKFQD
jgi:hypothetical protein